MEIFQRCLISVAFALTLIHIAQTAFAIGFLKENPKYPGKCWLEMHQKALDVGETWQPPNICETRTCSKNLGGRPGYIVAYLSCGAAIINGVTVDPSTSKLYPKCCMS